MNGPLLSVSICFFWHGAGHLSHSSILATKGGTVTEHHVVVIFLSFWDDWTWLQRHSI